MADEEKGNALDAVLESVAGGIESLFEPSHGDKEGFEKFFHKWFGIESWVKWVGDKGISRGTFLIILFIPLFLAGIRLMPEYGLLVFSWLFLSLPVLAPVGLVVGFWAAWHWYIQSYYVFTRTNPVLLEIKMPTEISKSPRAMEQVITSFWIRSGTTTEIDRNWYGGMNPYASLEICSFGGEIHFYIWVRKTYKNIIEAAMYSQYPEVEIVEVEDYASKFEYDPARYTCWGTDYVYQNYHQDKVTDVYPIKTYIDFELDKDPKDEHLVDPYASVLEVLSALNKEEQVWIQIVIKGYFAKHWKKAVHDEVEAIRKAASEQTDIVDGKKVTKIGFPRPTEEQKEQMAAMDRQLSKLIFDCGLRGIYIAPAGKMRSAEYSAFRWIWRPFNNPNYLNALRPSRGHNDFDYLWQDWNGVRYNLWTRRYFDMYRRRQFFHTPWNIVEPIHMSTEILATLWHPPATPTKPPGLQRIPVAKSEAPPNLPM